MARNPGYNGSTRKSKAFVSICKERACRRSHLQNGASLAFNELEHDCCSVRDFTRRDPKDTEDALHRPHNRSLESGGNLDDLPDASITPIPNTPFLPELGKQRPDPQSNRSFRQR